MSLAYIVVSQVVLVMGDHGQPTGPYKALQRFPFLSVTLSNDLRAQPGWKQHREALKRVFEFSSKH